MPRGGSRLGAGCRQTGKIKVEKHADPLDFLLAIMNRDDVDLTARLRAAIAACQFMHPRVGEAAGKKEQRKSAAEQAANTGPFVPQAIPGGLK